MSKYYRPPPESESTKELVFFIMENGLGRARLENSLAEPWSTLDLALALAEIGHPVSETSIVNWRAGAHPPSLANMRGLAILVANTIHERERWLDAFRAAKLRTQKDKFARDHQKVSGHSDKQSDLSSMTDVAANQVLSKTLQHPVSRWVAATAVLGGAVLTSVYFVGQFGPSPQVSNLIVCDENNFSKGQMRCLKNISEFPTGTRKVYTSFSLDNVAHGAKFKRVWFRCGRQFAVKESHNAKPWEGWTWTIADDLSKDGPFSLNVIVEDVVAVREFTIGDANATDCHDY